MLLSLSISPCPNDTFSFDALINCRIPAHGLVFDVSYKDIEELNCAARRGEPDITKISYSIYPKIASEYELLDSGSALGRGNGQLLVRREGEDTPLRRVASPGVNTTANALLCRYFPEIAQSGEIVPMLFSDIAAAVRRGEVDGGVLIHEGRFVYRRLGLEIVADLGRLWEQETQLPLPLGAIVIRRTLPEEVKCAFARLLAESVRFARQNPMLSRPFVREHAQELDDDVIESHIGLFVNEYTESLGAEGCRAVERLTGCRITPCGAVR